MNAIVRPPRAVGKKTTSRIIGGMRWQTLLVPHDYSPCADRALGLAVQLAKLHQAKIVLLHVTDLPPGLTADAMITDRESGETIRVDAYAAAQAARELETRARPVRDAGVAIEVRSALGSIAEQVIDMAADVKADLIVMGTHGRTGLAHLFLGSMAEKVLRNSPIPVLTVREGSDARRTTADMVVTDLATD
jgi:nucleotide-binding universal stress UspA family protein